jgi:ketosteroid isomerase-like protein
MKRILFRIVAIAGILVVIAIGGLILLVKATSDELDTVTDQNGKKITIRIAGDPMQHVQWVTSGWWDRGGDAVVSEALSRTITPAKPPCRLDPGSKQMNLADCSTMAIDICTNQVSFKGFVQRGPGANEIGGESIGYAELAVKERYGAPYVTDVCNGKLVSSASGDNTTIAADSNDKGTTEPHSDQTGSAEPSADTTGEVTQVDASDVRQTLDGWAQATNDNDVDRELSFYADGVDRYFLARNVTREFIREDKEKLYSNGERITSFQIDNVSIDQSSPDQAVALLTKHWNVVYAGGNAHTGQTKSRLWLRREQAHWVITGEQDLK